MQDTDYEAAWAEDKKPEDEKKADPIVSSIKAAKKADEEAFADAFKNDKFGIDIEAAPKKGEEVVRGESEEETK